jgi:hypothetical protein
LQCNQIKKHRFFIGAFQILICRAHCSHKPTYCFASLFQKRPLHAQWRSSRARSPCYSVSFGAFLCASCLKEKRLKVIDIETIIRFFFGKIATKKKLSKKKWRIRLRGERHYAWGDRF